MTLKIIDAARYLNISVSQLESFTDLGWVKFCLLENGELSYQKDELDKFDYFYLKPLSQVVKV